MTVQELREDNSMIVETKALLEDQLEASEKRAAAVNELENVITRHKTQLSEVTLVRRRTAARGECRQKYR